MSKARLILLGGFLGAGKTTAIARLAGTYLEQGLRVVIVTNDQASELVDTYTLRAKGFDVAEVAGACFCCRFDELIGAIQRLGQDRRPDVILAEPVGSCTDLVATVIQPLTRLYEDRFEVAPFGVILKPKHGRRILSNDPRGGFSPKAAYIFRKQLEEADFLIVNRIDEMGSSEVQDLVDLVQQERPGVPVLRMSARTGEGFDGLLDLLEQGGESDRRAVDVDYDVYAAGEAELGWLNCRLAVSAQEPFSLDSLIVDLVDRLRDSLGRIDAETAHLKTIGMWEGFHGVANLISGDSPVELSLASACQTRKAELIVNARVAVDPELLGQHVREAVQDACREIRAEAQFGSSQQFRPGRPVPTYRIHDGR